MKRPAVIVYDVFDDDRRARLREALGPVADRFQQSGWLIPDIVGGLPREIVATLGVLLAPKDRLRVYAPCPACVRSARRLPPSAGPQLRSNPAWIAY